MSMLMGAWAIFYRDRQMGSIPLHLLRHKPPSITLTIHKLTRRGSLPIRILTKTVLAFRVHPGFGGFLQAKIPAEARLVGYVVSYNQFTNSSISGSFVYGGARALMPVSNAERYDLGAVRSDAEDQISDRKSV